MLANTGRRIRLSQSTLASLTLALALTSSTAQPAPDARSTSGRPARIERRDFYIHAELGIRLFVREVRGKNGQGMPLLLIHGARVPGLASFDLPVTGGSLAADLAQAGLRVYIMDARGYGRSTRPKEMSQPPQANAPLVKSAEVVRDIDAAVNWIRTRAGQKRVALYGWATGGHWGGYYASLHSDKLLCLVVLNTLYGKSDHHPLLGRGSDLENPQAPGEFNRKDFGAYRFNSAESLLRTWDSAISGGDKSYWRDPKIAEAYVRAAMASDASSGSRVPVSFRAPTGAMEDSFYLATGHQSWEASRIRVPVFIIRSERDFWSRADDAKQLAADLVNASEVKTLTIPGATHWVHLDRTERGRSMLVEQVVRFVTASAPRKRNSAGKITGSQEK